MRVKSLYLDNFFTFKNTTVLFDTNGIRNIVGKNRVGKSALYEGIVFCFFGTTVRGADTPLTKGESKCTATIEGNVGNNEFSLSRSIDITGNKKITFFINKTHVDSDNNTILQRKVEEFIGFDIDTFITSTLFGHNSFKFAEAPDSVNRKILMDMIGNKIEEINNAGAYCNSNLIRINDKINSVNSNLDKYKLDIEEYKSTSEVNKSYISTLKSKLKKYKDSLDNMKTEEEKLLGSINSNIESMNVLNTKLGNLEDKIDNLNSIKDGKCYVCGSKISILAIKDNKSILLEKIKPIKSEITNTRFRIDRRKKELYNLSSEIDNVRRKILSLETELSRISGVNSTVKKVVESSESKILSALKEIKMLEKERDIILFWIRGFGGKGIISYIIEEFIDSINSKLITVSKEITYGSILVQYKSTSETKKGSIQEKIYPICFLDGEEYNYKNISNSEKQRVNIMTMIAFMEMNIAECNVVFFDEVFEGLDEEASEMMSRYIEKKFINKNCNVISHMPSIKFEFSDVLTIVRSGKFSNII